MGPIKKGKRQYHISPSKENKENQRDLGKGWKAGPPPISLSVAWKRMHMIYLL